MQPKLLSGLVLLCMLSSCLLNNNEVKTKESYKWPQGITAPIADIKPHNRTIHGDTVPDNYYWMIDYFKKGPDSTKVVDYLKAENKYLDTMMSGTKKFQKKLFDEMKARIKEKDESVPFLKTAITIIQEMKKANSIINIAVKKDRWMPKKKCYWMWMQWLKAILILLRRVSM